MICSDCGEIIPSGEAKWAYDSPYCEECFNHRFELCTRCDDVIHRTEAFHDHDGYPYCPSCYDIISEDTYDDDDEDDDYDYNCPDNPEVNDEDRIFILKTSRDWLRGYLEQKQYININSRDEFLTKIREEVGLTANPIYLFGLINRDEYQIVVSENLYDPVEEAFLLARIQVNIVVKEGYNRLGISLDLRENYLVEIIEIIKQIVATSQPELTTSNL